MSDQRVNAFVASGTAAERAAFTPDPPALLFGPAHGYFWYETDTGDTYAWDGAAWQLVASGGASAYTDENAQDAVGGILTDTDSVDFTYNDGGPSITAALKVAHRTRQIQFTFDGGEAVLEDAMTVYVRVPVACTIVKAYLVAKQSGSIVIDVWKDSYANFPPANADSITASATPALSSAQKMEDTTLTGWTTSIAAGDWLAASIEGAPTTIEWAQLVLEVTLA
jgi:hypothetical protein